MRRRAALLATGLLAGAAISVSGGTPAHAQTCTATDPVLAYVCRVVNGAPEPGPTIDYYYEKAGEVVYRVYCTAWPPC